jgi:creatinine amidohydrolase
MPVVDLAALTWDEFRDLPRERLVAILPVGATEAHGPHLPLGTDVIIAEAMARAGAEKLSTHGATAIVMPPIAYSVARYAAGFAGTLSLRPQTAVDLVTDVVLGLGGHGVPCLALANAHLEPAHIETLYRAAERIAEQNGPVVVFPDVTRKPWALRLTDEFKSGACHAGRYEGSIVMAARPELVRDDVRRGLSANPSSLSRAIRDGKTTFEEAGGPDAYFGDPAAASAEEGLTTIELLGAFLDEAVRERLGWL